MSDGPAAEWQTSREKDLRCGRCLELCGFLRAYGSVMLCSTCYRKDVGMPEWPPRDGGK